VLDAYDFDLLDDHHASASPAFLMAPMRLILDTCVTPDHGTGSSVLCAKIDACVGKSNGHIALDHHDIPTSRN
jgi:hypothetical protein